MIKRNEHTILAFFIFIAKFLIILFIKTILFITIFQVYSTINITSRQAALKFDYIYHKWILFKIKLKFKPLFILARFNINDYIPLTLTLIIKKNVPIGVIRFLQLVDMILVTRHMIFFLFNLIQIKLWIEIEAIKS